MWSSELLRYGSGSPTSESTSAMYSLMSLDKILTLSIGLPGLPWLLVGDGGYC